MQLTQEEKEMLEGKQGFAVKKSMEILVTLGEIFGADRLIPVSSVQVAGVSYHNLGEAGLEFLSEMAKDGRVKVLTTLNPAGTDIENWYELGISGDFTEKQRRVIDAFKSMGIIETCTCIPYLIGNLPMFSQHVAWSESSAVVFANSVLGARTNREGGPSALAAALTGRTPNYGLHLDENRQAQVFVDVQAEVKNSPDFGALGMAVAEKTKKKIPMLSELKNITLDRLKIFGASIVTYGGPEIYHIQGVTPNKTKVPEEKETITDEDLQEAYRKLNDAEEPDFVGIGCPHCSIDGLRKIAEYLKGKKVRIETWIFTSRKTKTLADKIGYTKAIEDAGAKFACDTCMAVAPLKGRFKCLATNSAKACFYGRGPNNFKTRFGSLEKCLDAATGGKWE